MTTRHTCNDGNGPAPERKILVNKTGADIRLVEPLLWEWIKTGTPHPDIADLFTMREVRLVDGRVRYLVDFA